MGADGKYYFLNAKALNKWMRETFGTKPATSTTPLNENHVHITSAQAGTRGENLRGLTANKKGIYSMVAKENIQSSWASGHADLINNSWCPFDCFFYDENNNLMPVQYIDIWILE